jgi:phosphoribosylformimino-5-aminoimidazole carboxamide ribotide isomerase
MRIIPAIDIIDGKCVRLSQGDYNQKIIYNENPLEVAKEFEANGIEFLHLVDLDGAKAGKIINWKILEKIASQTQLKIDVGGGIKSDEDLVVVLKSGAQQVNIGSLATSNKTKVFEWMEIYGAEKIILSADVKGTKVAVSGWIEDSGLELNDLLKDYISKGLIYCVCTDISKDGMLLGPSIELYRETLKLFPDLKLIASGGVASINDVMELKQLNMDGVIIGKAIYEGKIKLNELMEVRF